MTITEKFPFILHGGDYNPEQFSKEVWVEDVRLMKEAGVNVVTLPVFGWGNLQPAEDKWTFEWLDEVMELLHKEGIRFVLATATAATPPWVDAKYPDILRTNSDGVKMHHGGRHTFCPSSANFKRLSGALAKKMAERYSKHPGVLVWHVSNEYGNHCFCELCSAAFRTWLKARYGTLDEVNKRWNMFFWGQTFTDWSQIEAPTSLAQRNFQGLLIDYDRFQSEAILKCCENEIAEIRKLSDLPITTNMMGPFYPLDYHEWAKKLDVISWDCYPPRSATPSQTAFRHSLMRGLKEGEPWMLMEQTPSQQNWQKYNSLKRPGVLRLWSYQAMAHGADAVMYFQWRRSPGAQEMFHGAVVEHAGRSDARVFKEVAQLGSELKKLGVQTLGGKVVADVALLFDWNAWWAVAYSSGPSVDLDYHREAETMYAAVSELGYTVDVVSPTADLSKYKLVITSCLKMLKPGIGEKLEKFVSAGGTLVSTFFTGIVDETDRAFQNGYPGPLAEVLGIWVEETDALAPDEHNEVVFADPATARFRCGLLCDRVHLNGAKSLAHYGIDFYKGTAAVTENHFGAGLAYYIATRLEKPGLQRVLRIATEKTHLKPTLGLSPSEGLEAVCRVSASGEKLFYLLNHKAEGRLVPVKGRFENLLDGKKIDGEIDLAGYGVALLKPL